jgi:hypothetical protein
LLACLALVGLPVRTRAADSDIELPGELRGKSFDDLERAGRELVAKEQ